jgi:hypothetical protein
MLLVYYPIDFSSLHLFQNFIKDKNVVIMAFFSRRSFTTLPMTLCFFGFFSKKNDFKNISRTTSCSLTFGKEKYPVVCIDVPQEIYPKHLLMTTDQKMHFGYDNQIEIVDKENNHSTLVVDGHIIGMSNNKNIVSILYKSNEGSHHVLKYDATSTTYNHETFKVSIPEPKFRLFNQVFDHLLFAVTNNMTLLAHQHLQTISDLRNIYFLRRSNEPILKLIAHENDAYVLTANCVRDLMGSALVDKSSPLKYTDITFVDSDCICVRYWTRYDGDYDYESFLQLARTYKPENSEQFSERIFVPSDTQNILSDGQAIYCVTPRSAAFFDKV